MTSNKPKQSPKAEQGLSNVRNVTETTAEVEHQCTKRAGSIAFRKPVKADQ